MAKIILIAAIDENRLIGANKNLALRLKADMDHFVEKTIGNICIMGRETWESIPDNKRPLEDRLNIVVTSNAAYKVPENVLVAANLQDAIRLASKTSNKFTGKDIYICGGQRLYEESMQLADALEMTEIWKEISVEGKTDLRFFPEIDPTVWTAVKSIKGVTEKGLHYAFITYERIENIVN